MSKRTKAITCPVCGIRTKRIKGFYICPNKDYKADEKKVDEVWQHFIDNSIVEDPYKLVRDLVDLNVQGAK